MAIKKNSRLWHTLHHNISKLNSAWYVKYLRNIGVTIGDRTKFHGRKNVDITRPILIKIGNDVTICDDVTILTHGHDWSILRNKYQQFNIIGSAGKVTIGNNVFVGTKAIILKGVTIGSDVIIGAGSIVTKDIPTNSVALGIPCRVVKNLDNYYRQREVACYEEALNYTAEIIKTGKKPIENSFYEFFHFFSSRHTPVTLNKFSVKKQLGSSYTNYLKTDPVFEDFSKFVEEARKRIHLKK